MSEGISYSVPARIGLLGNPSDGYFGQCISLPVWNWEARVSLTPAKEVELPEDEGLRRIMDATFQVFEQRFECQVGGFRAEVSTTIPRQVGLAGSSAIEMAFMRCLMEHNGITTDSLDPRELAELVQSVETDILGMVAGLQDRLPQAYGEMMHMDFRRDLMEDRGYGDYTSLDSSLLPALWLANAPSGDDSGAVHSDIARRWEEEDSEMVAIIAELARGAELGMLALESGEHAFLSMLIDANFDLRTELFGAEALGETYSMVELARGLGSCAKQSGSGGAIFGIVPGDEFDSLAAPAFAEHGWSYHRLEVTP